MQVNLDGKFCNEELTRVEAIEYLQIDEKQFNNYFQYSKEVLGFKKRGRWYFNRCDLEKWKQLKDSRIVTLTLQEYEQCFEFAIRMVYSSASHHGTGIRGQRSEMQAADDWVLGILAEFAIKKFLNDSFNTKIALDTEVHPGHITPQDIDQVIIDGQPKKPQVNVAIKASKIKSCFLVVPELEFENVDRKSDVYIFARVGLPSDHLFRFLRDHSFIKRAREYLDSHREFRKIEKLDQVKIWICGYSLHGDLEKVTEIPGQKFENGFRYVKSVADMKNSFENWQSFVQML